MMYIIFVWIIFCFLAGWTGSGRKSGFSGNLMIAFVLSLLAALALLASGRPGLIAYSLPAVPLLYILLLIIIRPGGRK